jgi:hypothetical protein
MRGKSKRCWLAAGSIGLLLIAVTCAIPWTAGNKSAKLQLTAVDQRIQGDALVISVLTSNAGSAVLVNGGNCEVRYQKDGVWSTNSLPGFRSSIAWLLPGQVHTERIKLPLGTSRFQVGAGYEVAHGRVAAACRIYNSPLPHGLSTALVNGLKLLPYRAGRYVEFWDNEHDVRIAAN